MQEFAEYVQLERVEDRIYFTMSCRYPHELCVHLKDRSIRRLAKRFTSLGKGKRRTKWKARAKSKELSFTFIVNARYEPGCDNPCIYFFYKYYNYGLESVSESFTLYNCFSKAALLRFGKELSEFERNGKATLCEK